MGRLWVGGVGPEARKAREELRAAYGPKGEKLRAYVDKYDFRKCGVAIKQFLWKQDTMLFGLTGSTLALTFGDLVGARKQWNDVASATTLLIRAAENGIVDLDAYGPEWRGLRIGRAAAICIGDVSIVKGLFENTFDCKAARDEYTRQRYNETNAKSKMGIMVGYWKEGDLCYNTPESQLFVARALVALLDAVSDSQEEVADTWPRWPCLLPYRNPAEVEAAASAYEGVDEFLPSEEQLLGIARSEMGWDVAPYGLQHPSLIGAALYLGSGRARTADSLVSEVVKLLVVPLNRLEGMRLLARCRYALGKVEEAVSVLEEALKESKEAGMPLVEALCARDCLRLLRVAKMGSSVEQERMIAALKEAAERMVSKEEVLDWLE
jgi:hypothetical protein